MLGGLRDRAKLRLQGMGTGFVDLRDLLEFIQHQKSLALFFPKDLVKFHLCSQRLASAEVAGQIIDDQEKSKKL